MKGNTHIQLGSHSIMQTLLEYGYKFRISI
jgi:hypothetical protein